MVSKGVLETEIAEEKKIRNHIFIGNNPFAKNTNEKQIHLSVTSQMSRTSANETLEAPHEYYNETSTNTTCANLGQTKRKLERANERSRLLIDQC